MNSDDLRWRLALYKALNEVFDHYAKLAVSTQSGPDLIFLGKVSRFIGEYDKLHKKPVVSPIGEVQEEFDFGGPKLTNC
jgi:hypothetical protein